MCRSKVAECCRSILLLAMLGLASALMPAMADELKPAYLEIQQETPERWSVYYKTSAVSRLARQSQLLLPDNCVVEGDWTVQYPNSNRIQAGVLRCEGSLEQQSIGIQGLANTTTDALVRIESLSAPLQTLRLTPKTPSATIPTQSEQGQIISNVALTYAIIGVEHIVWGYDHLLFVLALVLLLREWRRIVWAVTAFTVAHSLTLVGTTLGWFALASKPVEAIIALSIVFLAVEILKQEPLKPRLSERLPWLVAFLFGLLHGFGFAGALADIGLPQNDIPLALFSFNLGVEIGQLAIVLIAVLGLSILRRINHRLTQQVVGLTAYGIGGISSFWLIERILS